MMTVQCPSCQKVYNIPESMAGKQVRCKACQTEFIIGSVDPSPSAAPSAPASPERVTAAPRPAAPVGSMQTRAPRGAAPKSSKTMLLVGGAVAAVVGLAALAYFVVVPMVFGGQAAWAKPLIPKNAEGVVHVDIEALLDSEIWQKKAAGELKKEGETPESLFLKMLAGAGLTGKVKLTLGEIDSVFIAASGIQQAMSGATPVVVVGLRLKEDKALADLISGGGSQKTHNGMSYVPYPMGGPPVPMVYIGQIDDKTFCLTVDEGVLKAVFDRAANGEEATLGDGMRAALDAVDGQDHFVAIDMKVVTGLVGQAMGMIGGVLPRGAVGEITSAGLTGVSIGMSANGTIELVGSGVFPSAEKAEKQAADMNKDLDENKEKLDEQLEKAEKRVDKLDGRKKEKAEEDLEKMRKARGMMDDIDIDQSGPVVKVSISIDTDDLLELMDD